jgi:membrane protein DedA with SNARE-associated domain
MTKPTPSDLATARQARLVAIVFVVTILGWFLVQLIGAQVGFDPRYAFLFDLAALAAFIWGLVVTYQIWRKRRAEGSR